MARVKIPDGKAQLTIRLDQDLHRKFKAATAQNGISMIEVIETMIKDYLKSVKQETAQS